MVPRTELVAIPVDATLQEVADLIARYKFGRYPVYGRDLDDILGVLYVKDLVPVLTGRQDQATFSVRPLLRPVLPVPTSIRIDALLEEMKRHRTHVAIVVDEFGGTAGMVTLDNIMERVVGDVPDEFERVAPEIVDEPDGTARVNGLTLLADVNEHFGLDLESEDSNTIGGYVFSRLGHRPQVGETVDVGPYQIRVEALDGLRIAEVRFLPVDVAAAPPLTSAAREGREEAEES